MEIECFSDRRYPYDLPPSCLKSTKPVDRTLDTLVYGQNAAGSNTVARFFPRYSRSNRKTLLFKQFLSLIIMEKSQKRLILRPFLYYHLKQQNDRQK